MIGKLLSKYALPAGIIGAVVFYAVSNWFSYNAGQNSKIAEAAAAATEYQNKQRELVEELETAKQAQEVIYRDKIKIVKQTVDPTQCADTDIASGILQQLTTSSPSE